MDSVPTEKKCRRCGEVKPLDDFRKAPRYKFGRYSLCRPCDSQRAKERYARPEVSAADAKRLKAWRAANPEKVRAQTARRQAKQTPEERAAKSAYMKEYWKRSDKKPKYDRTYREKHKDQLFAHYRENIEQSREYVRRRRSRRHANGEFKILPKEVRRLYASPCAVCGAVGEIHMDHVIPIARGGRHSIGNVQPLCPSCNHSKKAKFMAEWKYGFTTV